MRLQGSNTTAPPGAGVGVLAAPGASVAVPAVVASEVGLGTVVAVLAAAVGGAVGLGALGRTETSWVAARAAVVVAAAWVNSALDGPAGRVRALQAKVAARSGNKKAASLERFAYQRVITYLYFSNHPRPATSTDCRRTKSSFANNPHTALCGFGQLEILELLPQDLLIDMVHIVPRWYGSLFPLRSMIPEHAKAKGTAAGAG
jgi:hypothetical protein